MAASFYNQLQPKIIFPNLAVGLVVGIEIAAFNLALALMVFSGSLNSYVNVGITTIFLGSIVHFTVMALGSSYKGMLATVQDGPAVIIAVIITAMLAEMPLASETTRFYTALAAIMASSLITGLASLLLGWFRLGGLVSYIPYPVVGGFQAGSGMLLVLGGLQVMTGKNVSLYNLQLLLERGTLPLWLTGVGFGVALFFLVLKSDHYLVPLAAMAGATMLFFSLLALSGTSLEEAIQAGWLAAPIETTKNAPASLALFQLWDPAGFAQADWQAVMGQSGSLLACTIVALLGMMLNTSGIELATRQEINLNNDLRSNGWANLAAGMVGSSIGFSSMSDTVLGWRLGAHSRLSGIIAAGIVALVLAAGGGLLAYIPNLILGGMLVFTGMDFLVNWLYKAWFRLPHWEYAILAMIALLINTIGFLQGVAIGLAAAVAMFVVDYSRTQAVRHTLSGASYQSSVDRGRLCSQLLHQHSGWLKMVELQGYIFFGTANQVLDEIRRCLEGPDGCDAPAGTSPLRFIIIDFRLVSGLDSSAVYSFVKILRLVEARGVELALTHTTPAIQKKLQNDLPASRCRYFPELDYGIEWCEEQMLDIFREMGLLGEQLSLFDQLARTLPDPAQAGLLQQYLKRRNVQAGECIITAGCQQDSLYLIECGRVVTQVQETGGGVLRLRRLGMGACFGEIGLYTGTPATADVFAEQFTCLYVLSADDLRTLEREQPAIAAALHRFVAAYLGERLAKASLTIQAMR